jgi:sialidase-1
LLAVFAACDQHWPRSKTQIMLCESSDRGRTWSNKRPITAPGNLPDPIWNCPRITVLKDGRIAVLVDTNTGNENGDIESLKNVLLFSDDEGITWSEPMATPAKGICPDQLLELDNGRWIISCQYLENKIGKLVQRLWYSDDQGVSWSGPVVVGRSAQLDLCEVSILQIDGPKLVAFHRENTMDGQDCYKTVSTDYGEHWSDPIRFPIPGCHRPIAGHLQDGRILITYRYLQGAGGKEWLGTRAQNFMAALTDNESALAHDRKMAATRIMPIDYDRSPLADLGYSGWVQFDDGEIYIAYYIVDDAPKAQIRGCSLMPSEFLL